MKQALTGVALCLMAALASAAPAAAQMWFFPDYAVPSANGNPGTFIAGSYAGGLNDDSGKINAVGGMVGKTGESASFMAGLGILTGDADNELTLGAAVGVDVAKSGSTTISLQGGVGWMGPGDSNFLRVPIGVAFKGRIESPEAVIVPWVMPRVNYTRLSGGPFTTSQTDIGASGGVSFTFGGGFGVHTALDILHADGGDPIVFGIGGHFVTGR
jgi:hypothetical protein